MEKDLQNRLIYCKISSLWILSFLVECMIFFFLIRENNFHLISQEMNEYRWLNLFYNLLSILQKCQEFLLQSYKTFDQYRWIDEGKNLPRKDEAHLTWIIISNRACKIDILCKNNPTCNLSYFSAISMSYSSAFTIVCAYNCGEVKLCDMVFEQGEPKKIRTLETNVPNIYD